MRVDVPVNIDAEESGRLEFSLNLFERAHLALDGWNGRSGCPSLLKAYTSIVGVAD